MTTRSLLRCIHALITMTAVPVMGCDGSIEHETATPSDITDQGSTSSDVGAVASLDMSPDATPADQVDASHEATLRVEYQGQTIAAGDLARLGPFALGTEDACATIKMYNIINDPLMLNVMISEGPIGFGSSPVPRQIEGLGSASLMVCVDTNELWSGEATLALTEDVSIVLAASVEAPRPLLATGPHAVSLSTDLGATWQPVEVPAGLDAIRGALWAEGKAWLYGEGSAPLWSSEDGRVWQAVPVTDGITGIAGLAHDGGDRFMGVYKRDIIYSSDGATWTRVPDAIPDDKELLDIAWGDGRFVAAGDVTVAVSEDGQSWLWERRGGETHPSERIVSHGASFARVQSYLTRVSFDGGESWKAFDVCKSRESDQSQPSAPVFGRSGSMFTTCEGTLYARAMTDQRAHSWRRVGKAGAMPTPLLFSDDVFYGVDDEGRFWTSPTGFEWTEASGDAAGVTRMIAMGEPDAPETLPEETDCGDTLRCIDFEQELATLPPLFRYGLRRGPNVVAVDDQFAYSGDKSMRVEIEEGKSGQAGMIALHGEDFDASLRDKIYGRMMLFATSYSVYNWHMSESAGPLSESETTRVQYNAGGDHDRAFHNYYGDGKDCWNKSQFRYPKNEWFCWQVEYDRAANTMVILVNGQEVHRMDGTGDNCLGNTFDGDTPWRAPIFEHFNIGFRPFKTQEESFTAWIDDVVVDNEPVACPPTP